MAPSIDPYKLGNSIAQVAKNCHFDDGTLSPIPAPRVLSGHTVPTSNTRSLYPYAADFVYSEVDTKYLESPVSNDVWDRLYFIGADGPRYYANGSTVTSYALGLPRPEVLSFGAISTGDSSDYLAKHLRSYVVALVDDYGHVGPTSLPAVRSEDFYEDASVVLNMPAVPTGNYAITGNAKWRVYRSNFSSTGIGVYQFLGDVPVGNGTFTDTLNSSDLQEAAVSELWVAPPSGLKGFLALSGGFFAGFEGNTVYLSEPYLPHAWPTQRSYTETIVGLAETSVGLLVLTTSKPYLLVGTSPANMIRVEIESDQACVSADSIVDMGDYVLYASPDGICIASGNTINLATQDLINKEDWNYLYTPTALKAFSHEGRYVTNKFIFDPRGGLNALVESELNFFGFYRDEEKDEVYFLDGSGDLLEYAPVGGTTYMGGGYEYLTRVEEYLAPVNMGAIRITMAAGTVGCEFVVYADEAEVARGTVTEAGSFKLPAGYKARHWQMEFKGDAPLRAVMLNTSFNKRFKKTE